MDGVKLRERMQEDLPNFYFSQYCTPLGGGQLNFFEITEVYCDADEKMALCPLLTPLHDPLHDKCDCNWRPEACESFYMLSQNVQWPTRDMTVLLQYGRKDTWQQFSGAWDGLPCHMQQQPCSWSGSHIEHQFRVQATLRTGTSKDVRTRNYALQVLFPNAVEPRWYEEGGQLFSLFTTSQNPHHVSVLSTPLSELKTRYDQACLFHDVNHALGLPVNDHHPAEEPGEDLFIWDATQNEYVYHSLLPDTVNLVATFKLWVKETGAVRMLTYEPSRLGLVVVVQGESDSKLFVGLVRPAPYNESTEWLPLSIGGQTQCLRTVKSVQIHVSPTIDEVCLALVHEKETELFYWQQRGSRQ